MDPFTLQISIPMERTFDGIEADGKIAVVTKNKK